MAAHPFIFSPGIWHGEGAITFSMAEDELPFSMQWQVDALSIGEIHFSQIVDIENFAEKMRNSFRIWNIEQKAFQIELENSIVGKVHGQGVFEEQLIAWEFRKNDQAFEGYEIYQLQRDGSYKMRAEFTAGEGLRTFVKGNIKLLSL